jgi:hypothetical protein
VPFEDSDLRALEGDALRDGVPAENQACERHFELVRGVPDVKVRSVQTARSGCIPVALAASCTEA